MSRSYRHTYCIKDSNPYFKKLFNKRLRHYKDIPNGNSYRKINCSYDIHDYSSLCTGWNQYKKWYHDFNDSEDELYAEWLKTFVYK